MKKFLAPLLFIHLIFFLNIQSNAQFPEWSWVKSAGGTNQEVGGSIVLDALGNKFVTGYFQSSTINFGSDTLTNNGRGDVFLVKYDTNGNVLWAKSAGGTNFDWGKSVTVDALGNAYVTGYFESPTITFGSFTLTNNGLGDVFLVKYDANGIVQWAKSAIGTSNDWGKSVTVDAIGNAYVTGYFRSPTITFDSYTLTNSGSYLGEIFLVKYSTSGNVLWAKSAGGPNSDEGTSIALDALGNLYMTGYFESPAITFGTFTLTNSKYFAMFLVKYDTSGNVQWAKSGIGENQDWGRSVALDAIGNAYVTGNFQSPTLTFGSYTLTNNGLGDVFLVKYDASGNVLWAKSAGGTTDDLGLSVATDAMSNAYVTGNFNSPTITFDSYIFTNSGDRDLFLAKYDASGNVLWAKSAGGWGWDEGNSVAVDVCGNSYVTGDFQSPTITFGTITLTNAGYVDILFAKAESGSSGINENQNSISVSVYPNPVAEKIKLIMPDGETIYNIKIVNVEGEELRQQEVNGSNPTIDVSTLPNGMYILRILGDKGVKVKKFIKE